MNKHKYQLAYRALRNKEWWKGFHHELKQRGRTGTAYRNACQRHAFHAREFARFSYGDPKIQAHLISAYEQRPDRKERRGAK